MLALLEVYWNQYPDLRLGQIVCNFSTNTDPYYIEDNELQRRIEEALAEESVR